MVIWLSSVALASEAGAPPSASTDVARGWYLWRTGQAEAAAALAADVVAREPASLPAHQLHTAMQVVAGNGASMEAAYREMWGEHPDDPVRRVALAYAITLRRSTSGAWCDEVASLVGKVVEGEPHYWATIADQQRELRCTGQSDHAEAELRRLAKDKGLGFADGVLAKLDAKYIKEDLPEELEQVWTAEPHRVDRAGVLWVDGVSGPAKAGARRVASHALDAAVASEDPVRVHAALLAYRVAEDKKQIPVAEGRLKALDSAADPSLVRSIDTVADPEIYAKIDTCIKGQDPETGLRCIDGLTLPESGSIAAYAWYQRKRLNDAMARVDAAYAAGRAAYQADPGHRFNARTFATLALARHEDLPLAVEAANGVLSGRIPAAGVAEVDPALYPTLARDLDLRGQLLRETGHPEEALADVALASQILQTPLRQLVLGIALAEAGRGDEAAPKLAYALTVAHADTARVSEGRDALAKLAVGWQAGSVQVLIDAAARSPKDEQPTHPLVGTKLPATDAAVLPTPPPPDPANPKAKPPPPGIRVIVAWASWVPDSVTALDRLSTLMTQYQEKGVSLVMLNVDPTEVPPPEGLTAETRYGGPSVMRVLRSVALPTVVIVDGKGTVVAGLSPYDRGGLGLEEVLDGMLPKQ